MLPAGVLAALKHIGFNGPVVAEPYCRRLQRLGADAAVAQVSASLDDVFAQAEDVTLPSELIGEHPYLDEPPSVAADIAATAVASGRRNCVEQSCREHD